MTVTPSSPTPARTDRAARLAAGGAVAASILATACCWLPLLLVGLGASSVGLSAPGVSLRPLLVPGAFLLLGLAWLLTCRREASCCAVENPQRRPARLRHAPLWLSTLLVVAFAALPGWSRRVGAQAPAATPDATARPAPPQHVAPPRVLRIEGMTCAGCATGLEGALSRLPGVERVSVSYEKGEATILAQASVTREQLVRAVEAAGFRASAPSPALPVLKGSLAPFLDRFNRDADKLRVLALLSPT